METPDTLCMLVSKLPNGVETLLVNDPIFSREAITAYVGAQEKSDNQIKRRSKARSMVHLEQILIIINLKYKINAYFAATSMICTTVRNK